MPEPPTRHQIRIELKDAEKILNDQKDTSSTDIRLLKALLKHAPTAEGIWVIATDIITASAQEGGLALLAKLYTTGLLLPSESPATAIALSIGS
jgi:hypothetical protein